MQNLPNPSTPSMPRPSHQDQSRDPADQAHPPVEPIRHVVEQARRAARLSSRRFDQTQPEVWERPDMRRYLARHDIGNVYRLLQKYGMSQRGIAARTGQAE